jgi:hypothetical protein
MESMKDELLRHITDFYRDSRDFNGLYFKGSNAEERDAAMELVRDGLVQVVESEVDYLNPHIRPWPSRRSIDEQIESIRNLDGEKYGGCLYPTPLALKKPGTRRAHRGQPFRQALAKGRGTLELAYFSFDVLEQYRNDPRFAFQFHDFGADVSISDDAYLDDAEPEHDKTGMEHIGFAYDLSQYDPNDASSSITRRVCAFYGDLARLTPTHQQRWRTYQIEDEGPLSPHPVWWGSQMGHWPDGVGPFERFFFELEALNTLYEQAHGTSLFRTTERPREFGWLLRPSQREWDSFIQLLDKLLSENLRHEALDSGQAPRHNGAGQNLGTLNRLEAFLVERRIKPDAVRKVLAPLREVRSARQRPAHALRTDVTDRTFVHKQVELLNRVNNSLELLRRFWQTHPANRDWEEPDYAAEDSRVYRF